MKFGLSLLTFQRPPGDRRSASVVYQDLLRLAQVAEDSGFDSVWVAEQHFVKDGSLPSPLPMAAALAARTGTISIGTGVAVAPFYHPIRLAEDAAVTDIISGGRFILGLAVGSRREEFRVLNAARDKRGKTLEETVAVLRLAWGPDPFSFSGDTFSVENVYVTPKPIRGDIPIVIGAIMPKALERAGRLGNGFIASGTTDLADLPKRIEVVRAAADENDIDIYVLRYCFVGETGEQAWAAYRPGYAYQHALYASWFEDDLIEGLYARGAHEDQEEVLRRGSVVGTPDDIIRWIEDLRRKIGDFHFCPRLWLPGMSPKTAEEAVRLFGKTVISSY